MFIVSLPLVGRASRALVREDLSGARVGVWERVTTAGTCRSPHPHSLPIKGREAQVATPVFIDSLSLVGFDPSRRASLSGGET